LIASSCGVLPFSFGGEVASQPSLAVLYRFWEADAVDGMILPFSHSAGVVTPGVLGGSCRLTLANSMGLAQPVGGHTHLCSLDTIGGQCHRVTRLLVTHAGTIHVTGVAAHLERTFGNEFPPAWAAVALARLDDTRCAIIAVRAENASDTKTISIRILAPWIGQVAAL
jgi:hypothetical protein